MANLGDKVRDTLTGLTGIVTSRTEFLWGCVRIAVQPEGLYKDGQPHKSTYIDEPQVAVLVAGYYQAESAKYQAESASATRGPGGPREDPEERADPPARELPMSDMRDQRGDD